MAQLFFVYIFSYSAQSCSSPSSAYLGRSIFTHRVHINIFFVHQALLNRLFTFTAGKPLMHPSFRRYQLQYEKPHFWAHPGLSQPTPISDMAYGSEHWKSSMFRSLLKYPAIPVAVHQKMLWNLTPIYQLINWIPWLEVVNHDLKPSICDGALVFESCYLNNFSAVRQCLLGPCRHPLLCYKRPLEAWEDWLNNTLVVFTFFPSISSQQCTSAVPYCGHFMLDVSHT